MNKMAWVGVVGLLLSWNQGFLAAAPRVDHAALVAQVTAAEQAFARSMANRDVGEFQTFIADDAVFFNGPDAVVGKAAVVESWRRFFQPGPPPFAWQPDQVVVLGSGDLALSMGPVTDASGKVTARFNTVWRRQKSGRWLVVFDKGSTVCN